MKCQAKTKSGDQCKNQALPGKKHCYLKSHQKQLEEQQPSEREGIGHRLSQEKIEQIKADLQVYTSINFVAKRNEVAWDTVKKIETEYKDTIGKYREEKKKEFADRAWESIQDALKVGDKKLKLTLRKSSELDFIMDKLIETAKDEEVSYKDLKDQLKLVSALADYSLRDLSTFIGTLVDKHQLLTGEATAREENTITDGSTLNVKFTSDYDQ